MASRSIGPSPPETIRLPASLPQLDRSILASCTVEFAVRRETDGPDRTVVTFLDLCEWIVSHIGSER